MTSRESRESRATTRALRARTGALMLMLSLALGLALTAEGGCARLAPYQRGQLARPTMLLGDAAGAAESHVYAVQEGAIGGSSTAEGGCGCN